VPEAAQSIADDLLPACTVRVDIGGVPQGSGFFVAPGVVVTCAHVIEPDQLSSNANSTITVVDRQGIQFSATGRELAPKTAEDIAILKIADAGDHACVLLDTVAASSRDPIHVYGYPANRPEGESTTFESEGSAGGDESRWLKLKGGQAQLGMSGSPVLNVRTGGVCGVLRKTRNEAIDLGGYATPVTALLQLDPTLKRDNEQFHKRAKAWFSLLEPDQQRLLLATQGATGPDQPPYQVVVNVVQTNGDWKVRAHLYPDDEPLDKIADNVDLNMVRRDVARLFRDWASQGRVPQLEQIKLLGSILYGALFPGTSGRRKRFEQLLAHKRDRNVSVALRFDEDTDREIVDLPWEHLYVPARGEAPEVFLASDLSTALFRSLLEEPGEDHAPDNSSISVLIVAVKPAQTEADKKNNYDAEPLVDGIVKELKSFAGVDFLSVDTPDADELVKALGAGSYDVVHYVGFGRFRAGLEQIAFGVGRLVADYVEMARFAECFQASTPPKAAVLQLCEGGPGAISADFSLEARTLLQSGIDAVVAYQSPLSMDSANKFNKSFYERLAAGDSIERAVQHGRYSLKLSGEEPRAFVSPALFVRRPGGLALTAGTRERPTQTPRSAFASANA
jgi:hypothetical protein